ncbi:MAG: phospholipid carrier-dependent glycosyltransferase [Syntrophales bacterium]
MEPDEARYSDIPSLMNRTGDYVTPRLNHVIYLEKPPLAYWVTALFFKLFGENEFSSRLFTALSAWGCIFLVYFMGMAFQDRKTGLYAAAILSTFLFHFVIGRINILDMPLTFLVGVAIWSGYKYFAGRCRKRLWLYLLYTACALAFLTKGLIGPVFPFAILMIWLAIEKRWRDIPRIISPVGIAVFILIVSPWIVLVQKANSDFLRFFFVQEHFLRYTTTMHGRDNTVFYYIPVIVAGTLPWCAFLPQAFREGGIRWGELFERPHISFMLTWILFIFLFYSVSSSKLIPYAGPVFLPLAVIFARVFRLYEGRRACNRDKPVNYAWRIPVILQSLLFILLLLAPLFLRSIAFGRDLVIIQSEKWWLLIIFPVLTQIMIVFLPGLIEKKRKGGWFLTVYLLSAAFFASLIFPAADFLSPYKSAYPVARAARENVPPGQELYQYKISLYGMDFYDKIRTPVVEDFGELGYGIKQLPPAERARFFISVPEFYEKCRNNKEIYCMTQYRERLAELKKAVPELEILWDNGAFFLVRLKCF